MRFVLLRVLAIIFFVALLITSPVVSATETSIIKNIIKIKTYEVRSDGSYVFRSYGSAIAISSSRILTNAHVITGTDDVPTGHYEVCFSTDFEKVPVCRDTARLIAYDTVADLALLELPHTDTLTPLVLSANKIAIGSYVSMYGYPSIGGKTITRTDGKIAGYEQTMYKIDGSIDHGNSGGGAFNSSGELIGIPTAVAADNSSIGYMIPIHRIEDFLAKRTNNYEIYTQSADRIFSKFLVRLQSYRPNMAHRWNAVHIGNPRFYGFTLRSSMISLDNKMATWEYGDMYGRVSFSFSCTDDTAVLSGWQIRRDGLQKEQEMYPNWFIRSMDFPNYFTLYSANKGYDTSVIFYYKGYDSCYAEITYKDIKKDGKSFEKALSFLKKEVSFDHKYQIPTSANNPYFSIANIEQDTRVIRAIDTYGVISVLLGFEFQPGQWINATLEHKEYETLQELGNELDIDFDTKTTWDQYISAIADFGISASEITRLDLSSGQKGILVAHYNDEKKSTTLTFQYIYQTDTGLYAYWSWSSNIPGEQIPNITRLKNLFTSFGYPGKMFLK